MDFLAPTMLVQETPATTPPAGDGTVTGADATQGQAPARSPAGSLFNGIVPFVLIIVVFYFVMIGPERKQRKKREAMLAAIKKGDKVLTTGGMFATVAAVNEDSITLQAADDVRLRFSRQAVAQVLDDGSTTPAKA
jgi:preprotein translocase subunit YajC